jgi:ribulose-5-phosphate 4-epimerase/fuculose-1-phosphate aldolase
MARPDHISQEEWDTRVSLAALYRLAAQGGWSDIIYTHITARVPGEDEHFLINNFGILFENMRASDLVKIDHEGNIVEPARDIPVKVNTAGFNIHSAVHMSRPDLNCVIHAHTPAGIAVSAQKAGLLPLSQHGMMFYGAVSYHDYESFASRLDERERISADLGNLDVMILRNHGTLICAPTIGEAYFKAHHLERACQSQVMAMAGGAELNFPDEAVARRTQERVAQMSPASIEFFWQSSLAMVAAEESEYAS